jgi:paraquat-inducible protein B
MSKPANKTMIGLFVLGAIALVVIAIVTLGSGKLFKKTTPAVCYFEGSVGGLNEGAPVVFRGVKIGSVKDIAFRFDPKKLQVTIPVFIELEQKRKGVTKEEIIDTYKQLIDRGLKAQLEMQSIVTGQMQVALDFFPEKPAKFMGTDPEYLEIPTVQSPLTELQKKVEKIPIDEIFQQVLSAVKGIEKIVNSPEVPEIIHSINEAAKEIKPLAVNLEEAVKDVRKLVQNVDNRIGPLASSIEGTVNDFGKLARNTDSKIDTLSLGLGDTIKEIQKAVSSIEKTLGEAQLTLAEAKRTLSEDSTLSYEINETLQELQKGARSIRLLADDLKRRPESVLWGK